MYEKIIAMDPPDVAMESLDPFEEGKKLIDDATKNYTDNVDALVKNKSEEIMAT